MTQTKICLFTSGWIMKIQWTKTIILLCKYWIAGSVLWIESFPVYNDIQKAWVRHIYYNDIVINYINNKGI